MSLMQSYARQYQGNAIRTGHFGQTVSYTPQGQSAKSIIGVVGSYLEQIFNEQGNIETQGITKELTIRSDSDTYGQINVSFRGEGGGGDTVAFDVEGTTKTFYVIRAISQDNVHHRLVISTAPLELVGRSDRW